MNVPLVEMLFVMGILIMFSLVLIVWTIVALRKLRQKLDVVVEEEHQIKKELHLALQEEYDHIALLADLMGNVAVMKKISDKKQQKIAEAKNVIAHAKGKGAKIAIKKAINDLKEVDKLSREEKHIMKDIGRDIKMYSKSGVQAGKGFVKMIQKIIPFKNNNKVTDKYMKTEQTKFMKEAKNRKKVKKAKVKKIKERRKVKKTHSKTK